MTGGLGAVNRHYMKYNLLIDLLLLAIPDWAVVTLIGSLIGPGSTVRAKILQLYSVKGLKPPTVPVVSINVF